MSTFLDSRLASGFNTTLNQTRRNVCLPATGMLSRLASTSLRISILPPSAGMQPPRALSSTLPTSIMGCVPGYGTST